MSQDAPEVTDLLKAWRQDQTAADQELLVAVYGELRRLARVVLFSEREDHTLAPSDLIHEAYLRLRDRRQTPFEDRRHFFATAAQAMRRILIEHARRYRRPKHGGGARPVRLSESAPLVRDRSAEWVALDDALRGLERVDAFKAQLVELRFFGGFTIPETAEILDRSHATIERHWRLAQAWLYAEITGDRHDASDDSKGRDL